jgi:2-phospho-L-lactate/phosphoenolpyruvate guanylyltransferase
MKLHILIPCKSLGDGKTRLAQALDAKTRRALCTSFLQRTLDVALFLVPPPRCYVIAGDCEAAAIARARGVTLCDDPGTGLNEALRQGRERIYRSAAEELALLIVPIDLPWVTAAVLDELVRSPADVVIAPDRKRAGTNALYLGPRAARRFAFQFGANSFAAHRCSTDHGLRIEVYEDARLSFDVDRPEDYLEWQQSEKVDRFRTGRLPLTR